MDVNKRKIRLLYLMFSTSDEIILFSSTLILRLLKMRFGVRRLIIKVVRHKCDLNTEYVPTASDNGFSQKIFVWGTTEKLF